MLIRTPLAFIVLLLATGCSSTSHLHSKSTKNIEVALVDSANAEVLTSGYPDVSFASFPLIQGSLTGRTTTSPVLYLPISFGSLVPLPSDELAALIKPLATAPSDQMKADGLVVIPATTKLARVGTFLVKREEDEIDIGAGFLDTKTRDTLFLVYFSEESEVHGTVSAGGAEINVEIRLPRAGLHWLRIVKTTPTVWHIEVANEDTPISLVSESQ